MSSGRNQEQQDNPFAPPPEGTPDRPWQPRPPAGTGPQRGRQSGPGRDGDEDQDPGSDRPGDEGRPGPWGGPPSGAPGPWGPGGPAPGGDPENRPQNPWGPRRDEGDESGDGGGRGPRFDMTDPVQRRARYALLCGLWAFFFVIFDIPQISLLLAALALYWGVSSLRAKAGTGGRDAAAVQALQSGQPDRAGQPEPAAGAPGDGPARPHFVTAVGGLVAGGLALAMVLATFSLQFAYRDYFDCVSDSLTSTSRHACNEKIPNWVQDTVGAKD